MAILFELNEPEWTEWVNSRPPLVKDIAQKLPPNKLYRLKTTGQRVTMYSISENGTVTVDITGEFNLIDFDRQVFGINPDDLEECDLPKENERLGAIYKTEEEITTAVQPQLAELHRAGKRHNTKICELCLNNTKG